MQMSPLIPLPVSVVPAEGAFALTEKSRILVDPGNDRLAGVGRALAEQLRPATGYALPVVRCRSVRLPGDLLLTVGRGDVTLGDEGYELNVTPEYVRIAAPRPAGVFWGAQTLRQLLPPSVERPERQPGPWVIPAVAVRDRPRFPWRGFMLDVARHFFGVEEVKRVIDLLATYKLNVLHLHLTDDQGWRNRDPIVAATGGGRGEFGCRWRGRWILQPGGVRGDCGLRAGAVRDGGARNRDARAHGGGTGIVCGAERRRCGAPTVYLHGGGAQLAGPRQGDYLSVRGGRHP